MTLTIGSRGSQLALWQSEWAKRTLQAAHSGLDVGIEVIRTIGDANLAANFSEIGSKGVFTREVDEALLAGKTDFSVHSLKDLPTTLPEGLGLTAVSERADVRDALVTLTGNKLAELPEGGRIGTSSLRRQALLRAERLDLEIFPLRGNVDTRLRKLETEELDAIVLASAGLDRLGLNQNVSELLDPSNFVPAAAQGVMGIVSRLDDERTQEILATLEDSKARSAITAERSALAELGGGCKIPFGAYAREVDGIFKLDGVVAHPDGGNPVRSAKEGKAELAESLGRELAGGLLAAGGGEILREVLV